MKKLRKPYGIWVQNQPFQLQQLFHDLSGLEIRRAAGLVETRYHDKLICKYLSTDRYGIYPFAKEMTRLVPTIAETLEPDSYSLKLRGGYQALVLSSPGIHLGDSDYKRMLCVSSSSNGQHALQITTGLHRQICSNGQMVPVSEAGFYLKTRHYEKAVHREIKELMSKIHLIDETFQEQVEFIRSLTTQKVSLKYTVNKLLNKASHNQTVMKGIVRLSARLTQSKTDRLDPMAYTEQEWHRIAHPLSNEPFDALVPADKVYNCYIENFRNRQLPIQHLENRRILEAMEYVDEIG